jgi:predicted dehydrogenase
MESRQRQYRNRNSVQSYSVRSDRLAQIGYNKTVIELMGDQPSGESLWYFATSPTIALRNWLMVRIGLVGIGFMGMIHYLAWKRLSGAKVTALCSRDRVKLSGDWRSIRGNFGPQGTMMDLSGVTPYESFEELLRNPEIDLIDLCNPTHRHAPNAIAALEAGKHVLVEKAIALSTADADRMVAAAKANHRQLMVAHVLPFFPEFAYALQMKKSGTAGRLLGGHFTRVIARPDWSESFADADQTGGAAVDLHIHDTHFIRLLAGMPHSVRASGIAVGERVDYLTTLYDYGSGGPVLSCSSGSVATSARPFAHGFEIYFEDVTLAYHSGGQPLTKYSKNGTPEVVSLPDGSDPIAAFEAELRSALTAIETGVESDLLSGSLARDALVLCQRECESVKSGGSVAIA